MSSIRFKAFMIGTTSAVALAASSSAFSAEQQAQAVVGIEEITVTARRVEENIQRVPIAVTAFSLEKVQQQDIHDLWTLTKNIPGVNICCSPQNLFFTFIRGVGNGAPFYFADAPETAGSPSGNTFGFANFLDLQNVQILKGPQGTLFGLASNAGAIVYQPRKPGNKLGGYLTVDAGNFGRRTIEGALDVPIVEDRVLFRMAAESTVRDGYITNIRRGYRFADQNYYTLRPSLTLKVNDDIENYTIFTYYKSKYIPQPAGVLADFNFSPSSQVAILGTQALVNGGSRAAFDALRDFALAQQLKLGPYKVNGITSGCASPLSAINGPGGIVGTAPGAGITSLNPYSFQDVSCPFSWQRTYHLVNTTTWNFMDDWSVKNIVSLIRSKSFSQPNSTSGAPLLIFDSGSPKNNTPITGTPIWSDEIQFHGKVAGIIDLVFGTFSQAAYSYPKVTYGLTFGTFESATTNKNSNYDHSVFGQGNVDLGDMLEGLTFTAGYRYSWDKTASQTWTLSPTTLAITKVVGGPTQTAGHAKFSHGSYTAGFQYQFTPDTMFFVTDSKGYSVGGLQAAVGFEVFQPDALNNLEGGVKSTFDFANMKWRTNFSYYYGWFSGVKNPVATLVTNPSTGIQNLLVVTENAGAAHVQGLDADVTVVPTDYLELGGFIAYSRDKYTRFPSINSITLQPISLTSTPFLFTPKIKYNLRGTYHFPMDAGKWGDLSVTANYTHTGSININAIQQERTNPSDPNTGQQCYHYRTAANGYGPLTADGKQIPGDCEPAYHNLDLSLDWKDVLNHQGLDAGFIVTNVTKNIWADGQCGCYQALGVISYIPAVPRMFVIKLKYSF